MQYVDRFLFLFFSYSLLFFEGLSEKTKIARPFFPFLSFNFLPTERIDQLDQITSPVENTEHGRNQNR